MPPNPEQQAILEADDRIRLVRAAPGSGKTWLIGEAIRREIEGWRNRQRGIVALSFTNVAGNEIREKLGFDPSHPHFIGTLDSFLFRYVVRPFARLLNPKMPGPRLIPGISYSHLVKNQKWCRENLEVILRHDGKDYRQNIFCINFVGGNRDAPQFVTVLQPFGIPHNLSEYETQQTIQKKRNLWKTSGRVSHSDMAYMASLILADPNVGYNILSLLANRFSKIFLDEVQDTGWFLGRAILCLLADPRIDALVVGDPDQAIYEFNGATPHIFDEIKNLNGTRFFEITSSRRCPDTICNLAQSFSAAGRLLVSDTSRAGRVIMAIHDDQENLPRELLCALNQRYPKKIHRLITRKNSTVRKLNGGRGGNTPNFRSKPIENLHNAVNALRSCRLKEALSLAVASVARPLLGTDAPGENDLNVLGIDTFDWKKTIIEILLQATQETQGETLYQWGIAAHENMLSVLKRKGWWGRAPNPRAPNRPNQKATHQQLRHRWLYKKEEHYGAIALSVVTVHAVKGETHNSTILFVPNSDRYNPCPSGIWWSEEEQYLEERRIVYVAATRAKETFILCLHRSTYEVLRETRPRFVEAMECIDLADLIVEYRDQ